MRLFVPGSKVKDQEIKKKDSRFFRAGSLANPMIVRPGFRSMKFLQGM
jgi:hypothetical protein